MYNEDRIVCALAFKCLVNDNFISFKLPMEENKILQVFKKSKQVPKNRCNIEQARKTGWRIIKDWIDSQMAIQKLLFKKQFKIRG